MAAVVVAAPGRAVPLLVRVSAALALAPLLLLVAQPLVLVLLPLGQELWFRLPSCPELVPLQRLSHPLF